MGDDVGARVRAAVALHGRYKRTTGRFAGIATEEQIAEFEARTGLTMPPAFRYLQLNEPNVELAGQYMWDHRGAIPVEFADLYYLGGVIEAEYDFLHEMYYMPPGDPPGLAEWLTKMVPFARVGGQSDLCLDFAFDRDDPPVISVSGERGGFPSYRTVRYIAGSFLDYLELELGEGEDREMPVAVAREPGRVSQQLVDWYAHRDKIMGPPQQPSPT